MKKFLLVLLSAALCASVFAFVSCSKVEAPEGEVYEGTLIYDVSSEKHNAGVKAEISGNITDLAIGRDHADSKQYSYKNGVLSISGDFLSTMNAGETEITVKTDSGRQTIPVIFATKIITNAQEFQAINENLTGFYVLGNDIDLSSIPNFEPLGYFFEETSTQNQYFHGLLDGNGYTVKNANIFACAAQDSAQDLLSGGLFKHPSHQNGNNVGLFQIIGSSGIVRNVRFENIRVRARTIAGVIAGNCSGTVQNCIIDSSCRVEGGTHFYDDDCNFGGAFGIVAATGLVTNVISLTQNVTLPTEYIDYSNDYIGKTGNGEGWDDFGDVNANKWRYANVDKPRMNYDDNGNATDSNTKAIDSNNSQTNGIYAFAGKVWGRISDCYSITWEQTPYKGAKRKVFFGQTHVGANKPASGSTDMGTITRCDALTLAELGASSLYSNFDAAIWKISEGSVPSLVCPLYVKA